MKLKPMPTIGILAIVLALCVIGWLLFEPKQMEPVVTYKATETSQTEEERSEETLTLQERIEEGKEGHLEVMRLMGWKDEDPHMQKLKQIMETPEYLEYVRKQDEKPGFNAVLWWELHEKLGIPHTGRRVQEELFRKYFPDGEYADYESMMRHYVAELFLEDPSRSVTEVLRLFNDDRANRIWRYGYFNGYEGEYEWGQEIQKNAASIVAEFTTADIDPVPLPTEPVFTDQPSTTDVAEENVDPLPPQREDTPSFENLGQVPQTTEELEAELLDELFPDVHELPTNESIETTLKKRFSPQRFNTAVQTLNQYGPEEGLRRLKESDPELAAQVQRFIQRKQEQVK